MEYLPRINIEYLPVIAIFLEFSSNFTNENTNTRMKMIYFCQKGNYKIQFLQNPFMHKYTSAINFSQHRFHNFIATLQIIVHFV